MKTADEFLKHHFKGIDKEICYPVLVAVSEGFATHKYQELRRDVVSCQHSLTRLLKICDEESSSEEQKSIIQQLKSQVECLLTK